MFKPVNRHFLVELPVEDKEGNDSIVLLPENYKKPNVRYGVVSVREIADDVRMSCYPHDKLIVDLRMIEEIRHNNYVWHVILENHVVGILKGEK